jgi:hypothetical protein
VSVPANASNNNVATANMAQAVNGVVR